MKKKARKFTAEDMLEALLEEQEGANIAIIDEHLRYLAMDVGRDLTEEEQMAILDIVDEYTPKAKDGNYLCPLLPFDYAWKIYRIKNTERT
jgi:hypothetical protein